MDSPPANDKASATKVSAKPSIDSLRTVEFRTTIRGYHMDDVDEYLERVAVEAEEIQEQIRLSSDRVRQATDRVTVLEQQLEQARRAQQSAPAPIAQSEPAERAEREEREERAEIADDSLQRTLVLAQKFVDQTRAEAESEAHALVSESEARARNILADAEEHVRVMTEEAERNLREEVKRLDAQRADLVADVETIARHLETERSRIRSALTDMLAWVDDSVQPAKPSGTQSPQAGATSARPQNSGAPDQSRPAPRDRGSRGDGSEGSRDKPAEQEILQGAPKAPSDGQRGSRSGEPLVAQTPGDAGSQLGSIRAPRDEPGFSGPPTEQINATSALDADDDLDAPGAQFEANQGGARPGTTDRITPERSAPAHQRQMFAPGRDPHQAESGAVR
jgi:cell division initiation protein